jgi:hypothetical protein
MTVDAKLLHDVLIYNPETGILIWRARPTSMFKTARDCAAWNTRYAGKEAFTARKSGYPFGTVFDQPCRAHRVIWAMMTGEWPDTKVDHEDKDRSNNRWSNLRQASTAQNNHNRTKKSGTSSAFLGVNWKGDRGKWRAHLRGRHLGYFPSEMDAAKAHDEAALTCYGAFANLNFPEARVG